MSSYGCSVCDYNGDGWDDIAVAGSYGCSLFRNDGNGTFTEVSQNAGVGGTGRYAVALWADLNNDGYPDLFLGARDSIGTSVVYLNLGNGRFSDITASTGINARASVGTATFGDFNNDGRIDLFIATNDRSTDILYENVSGGDSIRFRDVSDSAGVGGSVYAPAMQSTWIDFDHDGFSDLFCVHDGPRVNTLWKNSGAFPFPDVAPAANISSYGYANSMGVAWADYNNDGWEDVYVTNIGWGGFYRNNGDGTFTDISAASGADSNGMSWGDVWADFDNDGDEDLFVSNLYDFNSKKSFLFENQDTIFRNIARQANCALTNDSYGAASGDFNNDGFEDLFVTNAAGSPTGRNTLLVNNAATGGHWLKLRLIGTTVNRMAIGTRVRVVAGGRSQLRTVDGGSGYCSQMSPVLHFGLGGASVIDTMEVFWRRDYTQWRTSLHADTTYVITEGQPVTEVLADKPVPLRFGLEQNYPNPFNPKTHLQFEVGSLQFVTLKVYDILGREIATLVNETKPPGEYGVDWDASHQPSGIYFTRLQAGSSVVTRKLVLIR